MQFHKFLIYNTLVGKTGLVVRHLLCNKKNELDLSRHFIMLILTHISQHILTFQLKMKIFSEVVIR